MIDGMLCKKLLAVPNDRSLDWSMSIPDFFHEVCREKVFCLLYNRLFGSSEEFDVYVNGNDHSMRIAGYKVDDNNSFDHVIERYLNDFEGNSVYGRAINRLKKFGDLKVVSIYNDEICELAYVDNDTPGLDGYAETVNQTDFVQLFGLDRMLDQALPSFQDEIRTQYLEDEGLEVTTEYAVVYKSATLGQLAKLDFEDSSLRTLQKYLSKNYLGFHSGFSGDGTFFFYQLFGTSENMYLPIVDMPTNFLAQIALTEQLVESYSDLLQCVNKEN